MGGGKSGNAQSGAANTLSDLSKQIVGGSAPLTSNAYGKILAGLQSGGPGLYSGVVGNAVSGSNLAASNALQQVKEQLGMGGMLRTPYGQGILANTALSGARATAGIPASFAEKNADLIPGLIATPGMGLGGLGGAAGAQAQLALGNSQLGAANAQGLGAGIGSLAGLLAALYHAAPAAAVAL